MQQNADTSLSCHHNNTNSKSDVSNSEVVPDIGEFELDKQRTGIETRLARDANLDRKVRQKSPWVALRAALFVFSFGHLNHASGLLAA